ncbi:MAG: rod shape-determining protein MreC [bacterium]|nr:rod shape-determining protein MreC [bacterium]
MVTSFRHDRQKKTAQKRWLVYLLILLVIILALRTPLSGVLSSLLTTLARPLWTTENALHSWLGEAIQLLSSKQALREESEQLKDALDLVLLEAYSRERLREENETLKAALGRADRRDLLLARVLATPGRSPYDTLVIDVGEDHGLVPGMKVAVDGDFVIGVVSKVTGKSAIATLYSSHGNELPVVIGTSSLPAIAKGDGGGNFRITLPRGVAVSVGDLAEIPAFSPQYIGAIEAIEERGGGSLQDLYVRMPLNIYELAWVYVVISENAQDE